MEAVGRGTLRSTTSSVPTSHGTCSHDDCDDDPILAIDLGRYKSVACAHDPASRAAALPLLRQRPAEQALVWRRQVDAEAVAAAVAYVGPPHAVARLVHPGVVEVHRH